MSRHEHVHPLMRPFFDVLAPTAQELDRIASDDAVEPIPADQPAPSPRADEE